MINYVKIMRIVKTKKELIKAIEDGERHIKIDSKSLYAACELAETYDSTTALLKHYAIQNVTDVRVSAGTMNLVADGAVVAITITISVLVAAIAIIGILKDKKVKIECIGWGGGRGTVKIG